MARSLSEIGVTGQLRAITTGKNESPLAQRLRTEAQLRALKEAGIQTESLKRDIIRQPKPL